MGALAVNHIDRGLFQVVLGTLLTVLSVYLIFRPSKLLVEGKPLRAGEPSRIEDAGGRVFEYNVHRRVGTVMTFVVGFLASLLGVGGGIFNVPAFVLLLGIPIEIATATSHFMVMGTAAIANGTNILQGDLQGQWIVAAALSVGTLVGGQIGPRISVRFGSRWLTVALSTGLFVVGVRLLVGGWSAL
ncbi:MAG: TSUP family transporter [Deltaproteobacteria bacterium]|nr:TSUP family transporter [Deltaproteobacteria bacterium]